MITIASHPEGCVLPVRAQPGARKARVIGEHAGALKLAVTAPSEDGKANRALAELLCELLSLKRIQVELLSGRASREKRFLIRDMTVEDVQKRVAELLP